MKVFTSLLKMNKKMNRDDHKNDPYGTPKIFSSNTEFFSRCVKMFFVCQALFRSKN